MANPFDYVWQDFFEERVAPKFSGRFRALVVETNDPLRMHRIRFKIPEFHNFDLKPEECPWAILSTDFGGKKAGSWTHPCIGDVVFIDFEKDYNHAPILVGFADPTRREMYSNWSVFGETPRPIEVEEDGIVVVDTLDPLEPQEDFLKRFLPKDERPMSIGTQDRYGNVDMMSGVGFFPKEHDTEPPPPDQDQLVQNEFEQSEDKPEVNNPDCKFMIRATKYGGMIIQSDVGYEWNEEFDGDFEEDKDFENDRFRYMYRLANEDSGDVEKEEFDPKDQRRIEMKTRLGHKFEMRDVGWKKSRTAGNDVTDPEFLDEQKDIAKEGALEGVDERWMKMRTKGGHLIELCDVGSHPDEDEFNKRLLLEELDKRPPRDGSLELFDYEHEFEKDKKGWNNSGDFDARFIRLVTRSGIKLVLDDRTSDERQAQRFERKNEELGVGFLIKGRAVPGDRLDEYGSKSGSPKSTTGSQYYDEPGGGGEDAKGYYFQFDERPNFNATTWGTPLGQFIEMNDDEQCLMIASRIGGLPSHWDYKRKNEFLDETALRKINGQGPPPDNEKLGGSTGETVEEPYKQTHSLLIYHGKEQIRFKSRAGNGDGANSVIPGFEPDSGEPQGIEIHDAPQDNPWLELIDIEKRGFWFSKKNGIGIWRAKEDTNMWMWMDDNSNKIVIKNDEASGKIQLTCAGNVEIFSEQDISIQSNQVISMKASQAINLQVGGSKYSFTDTALDTNANIKARNVFAYFPTVPGGWNDGEGRACTIARLGVGEATGVGQNANSVTSEDTDPKEPDDRL